MFQKACIFPSQRRQYHLKLASKIWPIPRKAYFKYLNVGNGREKNVHTIVLSQWGRGRGYHLPARQHNAYCNWFSCLCSPGTWSCKIAFKILLPLYSTCLWVHSLSLDRWVYFSYSLFCFSAHSATPPPTHTLTLEISLVCKSTLTRIWLNYKEKLLQIFSGPFCWMGEHSLFLFKPN
jgi:hypothetical protein